MLISDSAIDLIDKAPEKVDVCFLACHPGARAQMADIYEHLKIKNISCRFVLVEESLRGDVYPLVEELDQGVSQLVADVGTPISAQVFQELSRRGSSVFKVAYYDNPESFVPGGYSSIAATVIESADAVVFASLLLQGQVLYDGMRCELDLSAKRIHYLGYFPFCRFDFYRSLRSESCREQLRKAFFLQSEIEDKGQRFLLYLGGANKVYEQETLIHLCHLLRETHSSFGLDQTIVLLQRHPRASDLDLHLFQDLQLEGLPVAISPFDFASSLAIADVIGYYQTSTCLYFPLLGIPAAQIGSQCYSDLLVRNKLCSLVNDKESFLRFLEVSSIGSLPSDDELQAFYSLFGVDPDWEKKALVLFVTKY